LKHALALLLACIALLTRAQASTRSGIREDDVLVTEDGHEVLSFAAPKEIAEIEAYMATRGF
jgi:hypothetical protein